jgi:uncharacterized protein involved in exopolysaccharide biosynthesis
LRPFYRGLPLVAIIMVSSILLAKRYLRYTTPMYESSAKIKLADNHEGVANSNLYKDFDVFTTTHKIAAEVELIKSKVLVQKAIHKLNIGTMIYRVGDLHKTELYLQSPLIIKTNFNDEKWKDKTYALTISKDSLVSIVLPNGENVQGKINSIIQTRIGEIAIIKNEAAFKLKPYLHINDCYEFVVYSTEGLINKITSDIDVMSVDKDVPVLRISYKSPDPVKAAHVTNALAAAYIADYIDEKYKSADTTSVFLNRELKTYSGKLAASESAIEQYRDNNNIVNIRQETETDLRKISDLKKQLVSVQMNLVAMDSLNRYIKRGESSFDDLAPNFEAFTDLLSTEMIKKTKELQSEKRDLLMKYTPEHEKLKVLDAKIDDIKKYLIESIKNTENHLRVKYNNLQNTIADEEKKFIGLPTKEKTMTIMERDFGLNEQIYRFLHEKRTEAEIAKAAKISFHRVISEAEIPKKPVSPNATIIIVFSGFLGFLGGTAFVYFVSFIKGRVSNQETIYKNSATPIAALIPHASKKNKMTVAFNKWAIELDLKGLLSNGTVISFSSFAKAEGKSFISNELVKAIRLRDKKVLVVDVDGAMQVNTLTNYINLEKVPEKWQSLSVWHTMVNSWKENYDVIIIKNTPINDYPIVMQVMSSAVLNLIVLDSRKTKKVAIQNADLLKEDLSLYNMQFVLNRNGYTPTIYTYAVEFFKKLVKLRK